MTSGGSEGQMSRILEVSTAYEALNVLRRISGLPQPGRQARLRQEDSIGFSVTAFRSSDLADVEVASDYLTPTKYLDLTLQLVTTYLPQAWGFHSRRCSPT